MQRISITDYLVSSSSSMPGSGV